MHGLLLRQVFWLVAGLPVAAWCIYVAMRFLIFGAATDILRIYYEGLEAGRILFTIVEIGFFSAFNKLRHYTVTEAYKALIPALQRWLPVIQVYATILWALAIYYLVLRLWVAMPAFSLNMVLQ